MLRLHYSNRLEALIRALVSDRKKAGADAPFEDVDVAVSGRAVAARLRFALADSLGIVAGYRFPQLEGALTSRAEAAGARIASRARICQALLSTFESEDLIADPDLAPVRHYLDSGAGEDSRRFQLADELAGLFLDYDRCRPAVLSAWSEDRQVPGIEESRARWQKRLWRHLALELELSPLVYGFSKLEPRELEAAPLWVLGPSYVPRGVGEALVRLSQHTPVHVFALSPSREYWEDIASSKEERRAHKRGKSDISTDAPLALRLWGRPNRDTTSFLSEACNYDFEAHFEPPAGDSILPRWQGDILNLRVAIGRCGSDQSIEIHECPSVARELEVIAGDIWKRIRADANLRFCDFSIHVAGDMATYQARLSAAFHRQGNLPHHYASVPLSTDSRVVEAFEQLVELPLGDFTRPELLRLMTHPAVIARFPDVAPQAWAQMAESLGIVQGADRSAQAGTYIEHDLFNWDQGARRLALGAAMSHPGQPHSVDIGGTHYQPLELEASELLVAARFGLLSRSLIADARYAKDKTWPLSRWCQWFESLVHSYLHTETNADKRALARLITAIEELRDIDDGTALGYKLAAATVRRQVAGLTATRGELGADGVMVAPLELGHIVPAACIYVAGLGTEALPKSGRKSSLDVRLGPAPGDAEPGELGRLALLEAAMAARSGLYLSYVARDSKSGDKLPPSALIAELLSCMRRGYAAASDLVTFHPLRSWHESDVGESPSHAVRRRRAIDEAAETLRSELAGRSAGSELTAHLRDALEEPRSSRTRRALLYAHEPRAQDAVEEPSTEVVEVSISVLRRFLESPAQAWAAQRLGITSENELVDIERTDEPLQTDPLTRTSILRDVFMDALRSGDDAQALERRLHKRIAAEELGGGFPTGIFRERIEKELSGMLQAWREFALPSAAAPIVRSYGRARERASIDLQLPPLVLPFGDGRTCHLVGVAQPFAPPLGSLLIGASKNPGAKHRVRGFFEHVLRSASAASDSTNAGGYTLFGAMKPKTKPLAALATDRARAYLSSLVTDLVEREHGYALPCELALHKTRNAESDLEQLHRSLQGQRSRLSDDYGPLGRVSKLPLPEGAHQVIEDRFGLLFELEQSHD